MTKRGVDWRASQTLPRTLTSVTSSKTMRRQVSKLRQTKRFQEDSAHRSLPTVEKKSWVQTRGTRGGDADNSSEQRVLPRDDDGMPGGCSTFKARGNRKMRNLWKLVFPGA